MATTNSTVESLRHTTNLAVDPERGVGIGVEFLGGRGYLLTGVAQEPGQRNLRVGDLIVAVGGCSLSLASEDEADQVFASMLGNGVEIECIRQSWERNISSASDQLSSNEGWQTCRAVTELEGSAPQPWLVPMVSLATTCMSNGADMSAGTPVTTSRSAVAANRHVGSSGCQDIVPANAKAGSSSEPVVCVDQNNGKTASGDCGDEAGQAVISSDAPVVENIRGVPNGDDDDLPRSRTWPGVADLSTSRPLGLPPPAHAQGPPGLDQAEQQKSLPTTGFSTPSASPLRRETDNCQATEREPELDFLPDPMPSLEDQANAGLCGDDDGEAESFRSASSASEEPCANADHASLVPMPMLLVNKGASEGSGRIDNHEEEVAICASDKVQMPCSIMSESTVCNVDSTSKSLLGLLPPAVPPQAMVLGPHQIPSAGPESTLLPVTDTAILMRSSPDVICLPAKPVEPEPINCKVKELFTWLCQVSLQEYHSLATCWCDDMGAASLEEIAENIDDFSDTLELKPIERQRVKKWASNLLSRGESWQQQAEETLSRCTSLAAGSDAHSELLCGSFKAEQATAVSSRSATSVYSSRTTRIAMDSKGNTGLQLGWDSEWGICVLHVDPLPGQPGLSEGDYIIAIDGCSLRHCTHDECDATFVERLQNGAVLSVVSPGQPSGQLSAASSMHKMPAMVDRSSFGKSKGRGGKTSQRSNNWQMPQRPDFSRLGKGRHGGYSADRMWTRFRGPPW